MSGARSRGERRRARVLLGLVGLLLISGAAPPAVAGQEPTPRVVGGTEAGPGEFPVVVALVRASNANTYRGQFCGGTLIHESWVLTAGHCVEGRVPGFLEVYVGDHDLKGSGTRIAVESIHMHPEYDGDTLLNDIALLHLEVDAVADPGLGDTARLPLEGDRRWFDDGSTVAVVGWGFTEGDPTGTPDFPRRLRKAAVPVRSLEACEGAYDDFSHPEMLCAGFDEGGADACQGDSGGPLLAIMPDGSYLVVGIVSWGIGCADPGAFGVYTRTATYACWIAETMANGTLGYGRTTIDGTPGPDDLVGTGGPDVILGFGGDDHLRGGGGSDAVCGGEGADTLVGGRRSDLLDGGPGDDLLEGSNGSDIVLGGRDDDIVRGFTGADTLVGGPGSDLLLGQEGRDRLRGSGGPDTLKGGPNPDILLGGSGDDELFGNRAADLLDGGSGEDSVVGGGGFDTCIGEVMASCEA